MTSPSPTPLPPRFDAALLGNLSSLEWRARYVMEGFLSGRHASPFHGLSVEFREYREYQPGDDLRRVDWRLYARTDRLQVKRYEQETNARCYLLVDGSASMGYRGKAAWGEKLEGARTVAAALGWLLLRQGDAVGMLSLDAGAGPRYLAPSRTPSQLGNLLRELEGIKPRGTPALVDLLSHAVRIAHRRSLILLLTDLLEPSDAVEEGLKRLRFDGHEVVCFQVLDGDEIDFPFTGTAVFQDLESGDRRQVQAEAARERYLSRFRAFMEGWEALFRRLEMPHGVIRTDEDPGPALARLVAARRVRV